MIRILWLFLFLLFLNAPTFGQENRNCNYSIKGKIYDQHTKEVLSFVSIQIKDTNIGTSSDEDGAFLLKDLCETEYDLIFSRIGYNSMTHHHDFHHSDMEIFMVQDHLILEGVTIEAEVNRSELETTSSERLSGEDLRSVKSESLGDVVSQFTGVNTLNTGQNISKPIIHGLHSNRILVVNNGIRHEFQNWGIEHAPEIDPSLANEIQVIKGAATVRYGPDALGGVILVNPARLELETPLKGEVQLKGQSNGQSGEGSLNLSKGFKTWSIGASASLVKQGDLHAPEYQLTNTGKEESSFSTRFRFHPIPELDIEGYYSRFNQNLGILSGSVFSNLEDLERAIKSEPPLLTAPFSYEIGQPRQEAKHDLLKFSTNYITNKQALRLQYGYQVNQRKEYGVRRSEAPNIDLILKTHTLDLDWDHPSIGPFRGQAGVQLLEQKNDNLPGTNTVPFIPNYDQRRLGAYLIENLRLGEHLLEFGVRFDYMDAYIVGREPDNTIYRNNLIYRNFSGTLGYKHNFKNGNHFRTNLGTAWRAPNVAELYRFGQHSFFLEYGLWRYTIDPKFDFIVTTQGILDEEDRPVPAEVGYKWINTYSLERENLRAELTAYVNYIENYINSRPGGFTRTPRGVFIYYLNEQTDALFWGADLSVEWHSGDHIDHDFKASYLWAQELNPNDFLVEQPPANLQYRLKFHPELKWLDKNDFSLGLQYTFRQNRYPRVIPVEDFLYSFQLDIDRFANDASNIDIIAPPPAYFLMDIAWSGSWKNLNFQIQVKNVLNTSYRSYTDRLRYFADATGRNLIIGLGYAF